MSRIEMIVDPRHYVVGFLFDDSSLGQVILIEKQRPAWQKGFLNGVGGKVEPGESAEDAMRREDIEEMGVDPEWSKFASVEYSGHILHFFAARDATAFSEARAQTDEQLVRPWVFGGDFARIKVIPNLRWLIPMARHHLFHEKVVLSHTLMAGSGSSIS